jgi:RNA polymerase sigma-70 factor (ECF subfamily)
VQDGVLEFLRYFSGLFMHYSSTDDNTLLQGMLDGDKNAFDELYQRYWHLLYTRAMSIVRVDQDAQDVVQDVFMSVWKRKEDLHITTAVSAYLLGAVKLRGLAFLRDNICRRQHLASMASTPQLLHAQEGTIDLESRETERQIAAAVLRMPDRMKVIYRLSRQEALTHRQIAVQLNIEESTVKKQIQYALQRIRINLWV